MEGKNNPEDFKKGGGREAIVEQVLKGDNIIRRVQKKIRASVK